MARFICGRGSMLTQLESLKLTVYSIHAKIVNTARCFQCMVLLLYEEPTVAHLVPHTQVLVYYTYDC